MLPRRISSWSKACRAVELVMLSPSESSKFDLRGEDKTDSEALYCIAKSMNDAYAKRVRVIFQVNTEG